MLPPNTSMKDARLELHAVRTTHFSSYFRTNSTYFLKSRSVQQNEERASCSSFRRKRHRPPPPRHRLRTSSIPFAMSMQAKSAKTGAAGSWFAVCTVARSRLASSSLRTHRIYLQQAQHMLVGVGQVKTRLAMGGGSSEKPIYDTIILYL